MWQLYWHERGEPWSYDPGPAPDGPWTALFARTPDYRALGRAQLGREVFRWHFGPMFYRGRLQPGRARVLVIGQEGAQDESLAHRAFVGGTGARLQHLLRWIGITDAYLFLNTFAYPIFGQYAAELARLAQDPQSEIVRHRHELLELAASTNDLRLVISVGVAAEQSVATWTAMRGGALPAGARHVHVVHPGAVSAGDEHAVRRSFARAAAQIAAWIEADPAWLAPDGGGARTLALPYELGSAPVPFADLPFGCAWRLGRGATTSNRRDAQAAIQLFSADGRYDADVDYAGDAGGDDEGYAQEPGDRPYEPPRASPAAFDPGPGPAWARLLMGGDPGHDWPDFTALGLPAHASFGFGPAYRGRPDEAVVVVLADGRGHDDLFSARALTGEAGQRLQRLLDAAGFRRSYAILRVPPVSAAGLPPERLTALAEDTQLRAVYGAILRRLAAARVLIAIGRCARRLAAVVAPAGLPVIALPTHGASGWQAEWARAHADLSARELARDGPPSAYDGARGQVARGDLPYGTLRWQGSSGDRALQGLAGGAPSIDYVKLAMPAWAAALAPDP